MLPWLHRIHFLNLDIVAGVIASAILAERVCNCILPAGWWFVIPVAAWLIYTLDRVLDDNRASGDYPTLRHAFHHRNRRALLIACVILAPACAIVAVLTLPPFTWIIALCAGALVAIHHLAQHLFTSRWLSVLKDVNVVVTYTAAIWSVPVILSPDPGRVVVMTIACIVLVTWAIVVVESIADVDIDTALHQPSVARALGPRGTTAMVTASIGLAVALALGIMTADVPAGTVLLLMCLTTTCLPMLFRSGIDRPITRLLAELVLSLPYLLLFFAR